MKLENLAKLPNYSSLKQRGNSKFRYSVPFTGISVNNLFSAKYL